MTDMPQIEGWKVYTSLVHERLSLTEELGVSLNFLNQTSLAVTV